MKACLFACAALIVKATDQCDDGDTTNTSSYTCSTLGISNPTCYSITSDVLSNYYVCG